MRIDRVEVKRHENDYFSLAYLIYIDILSYQLIYMSGGDY